MEYPTDQIKNEAEYYALEFSADESGKVWVRSQTMWVGWADDEQRIELRKPRLIDPKKFAVLWTDFQMPFHVVNTVEDFLRWFLYGGNALVEKSAAETFLPDSLKPDPCVMTGSLSFTSQRALPDNLFRRAPTPKLRMSVIKRDSYRCKVCGRRPENHVDIELHVHHIRPHGKGGPTHEDNLITLCDTCHQGLDPHYEWSLYSLLEEVDPDGDTKTRERHKYLKRVRAYRVATQQFLK